MDKESTPLGQSTTLEFSGIIINFSESSLGKINIQFDELDSRLHYEVVNYQLTKINFKTIVAGLKGAHPQIIKASLNKLEDRNCQLAVTVSYEFLPEIKEVIRFQKREIALEETEQIASRTMRTHVRQLKDQINQLGTISVLSGQLEQNNTTEIYVHLRHKKTIFTLGLNFTKVHNNLLKVQMYYYNSGTKQQKSSGAIPEEGLYVHHNNGNAYVQLKFYAELQDFDMVMFKINDKQTGEYTLSSEKVQIL